MVQIQENSIAFHAKRAAQLMRQCGRWAMARYAQKRGVPVKLLLLAMRLEAADNQARMAAA